MSTKWTDDNYVSFNAYGNEFSGYVIESGYSFQGDGYALIQLGNKYGYQKVWKSFKELNGWLPFMQLRIWGGK